MSRSLSAGVCPGLSAWQAADPASLTGINGTEGSADADERRALGFGIGIFFTRATEAVERFGVSRRINELLGPAYATARALIAGGSHGGTEARAGTAPLGVRIGDAILPELDAAIRSTGHLVAETASIAESPEAASIVDVQARSNAEAIAQVCDAKQLGGDAVDAVDTPFSPTANSGAHTRRTDGTPLIRPIGLVSLGGSAARSLLGSSGTPGPSAGAGPSPGLSPGSPRLDPLHVHKVPAPRRPARPYPR